MKVRIRHPQDFFSGLLFIAFGLITIIVAQDYKFGTAVRMGPGYFPMVLGWIMVALGALTSLRSLWLDGPPIPKMALRPILMVTLGVLAFGALIDSFGLVVAALALFLISALGGHEFKIKEVLLLFVLLTAVSVGLFVYGIGLTFKVWPL